MGDQMEQLVDFRLKGVVLFLRFGHEISPEYFDGD